jgi:hypothetical protein
MDWGWWLRCCGCCCRRRRRKNIVNVERGGIRGGGRVGPVARAKSAGDIHLLGNAILQGTAKQD